MIHCSQDFYSGAEGHVHFHSQGPRICCTRRWSRIRACVSDGRIEATSRRRKFTTNRKNIPRNACYSTICAFWCLQQRARRIRCSVFEYQVTRQDLSLPEQFTTFMDLAEMKTDSRHAAGNVVAKENALQKWCKYHPVNRLCNSSLVPIIPSLDANPYAGPMLSLSSHANACFSIVPQCTHSHRHPMPLSSPYLQHAPSK